MMSIAVGQKKRGLAWPARPAFTRIDVTSGSANKIDDLMIRQISPLIVRTPEGVIFENLWQFSKFYPQIKNHADSEGQPTADYWHWREMGMSLEKGKRTPSQVTTLKRKFRNGAIASWTPRCAIWEGQCLSYIEARKNIYAPQYHRCLVQCPAFAALKERVERGESLLLIDFDGPPLDLYPQGREITLEVLRETINQPDYPFGHGYVIAGALLGFEPRDYTT